MNMHCAKLPILREYKKNDFLLKLLVFLFAVFTCSILSPLHSQQIKTVVIDAGHGGKDPGCHGNFAFEKEVCLSMALKYSLDLDKEAEQLDLAVQSVLDDGLRTKDIMSKNMKEVSTSDMGDAIIAKLK